MYAVIQIVDQLAERFDFVIVTSDRDADGSPLVLSRAKDGVEVSYLPGGLAMLAKLWAVLRRGDIDLIVFNSFFSFQFSILPMLLARTVCARVPVLMVPRGELFPEALSTKGLKKSVFLSFAHLSKLYRSASWQVTDDRERDAVIAQFPNTRPLICNELVPQIGAANAHTAGIQKEVGSLRVIYLSRITPKKNLLFVLETMLEFRDQDIELSIYGPVEDYEYWRRCQRLMARFTDRAQVAYHGTVLPGQAIQTFGMHHLLFFPTSSENFGYVILECILAGRPVLISDATPFRGLAILGSGEDYCLTDEAAFLASLGRYLAMDQDQYDAVLRNVEKQRTLLTESSARHRARQADVFDQLCRR